MQPTVVRHRIREYFVSDLELLESIRLVAENGPGPSFNDSSAVRSL